MLGYKINKELRLIATKYAGKVTVRQLGELLQKLTQDPDYSPAFNTLTDLLELTSAYTYEELESLSRRITDPEKNIGQNKNAYLVNDKLVYGITRVWASVRERENSISESMIFEKLEDALQWLGLPVETEIEFPF